MGPCQVCGKSCVPTCSRCKSVYYCGYTCQKDDWLEHKKVCKPIKGGDLPDVRSQEDSCEHGKVRKPTQENAGSQGDSRGELNKARGSLVEIPSMITVGKTVSAALVCIHHGIFYAQISLEDQEILTAMVHTMNEYYDKNVSLPNPPLVFEKHFYACQFSNDGQWYRVYVQTVSEDRALCNVWYIDFGNCEDVQVESLRKLEERFSHIPAFSIRCKLSGCDGTDTPMIENFIAQKLTSHNVQIEVIEIIESFAIVNLYACNDNKVISINKLVMEHLLAPQESKEHLLCAVQTDGTASSHEKKFVVPPNHQSTEIVDHNSKELEGEAVPNITSNEAHTDMSKNVRPTPVMPTSNLSIIIHKFNQRRKKEFDEKIPSALLPNGKFMAKITHVRSVEDISVSVDGPGQEALTKLESDLNATCDRNFSLKDFTPGYFCAAKSSSSNMLRAEILCTVSVDEVRILFVDYGRQEVVKKSDVCRIPQTDELWKLEKQAITCGMKNCLPGNETYNNECVNLLKQCKNQVVLAEIDTASGDCPALTMYIDESVTINEYLNQLKNEIDDNGNENDTENEHTAEREQAAVEKEGVRKASEYCAVSSLKLHSRYNIVIPHFLNPGDFTCQLMGENQVQLAGMTEKLSHFYENQSFRSSDPLIGLENLCAVKYHLDSKWYRGRILNCNDSRCNVLFVDYGNIETVTRRNVRPLLEEFHSFPIQGIRSMLFGCSPKEKGSWSAESISALADLQNCECSAILRNISSSDEAIFDILIDDNKGTLSEVLISSGYAVAVLQQEKNNVQRERLTSNQSGTSGTSVMKDPPHALQQPDSACIQLIGQSGKTIYAAGKDSSSGIKSRCNLPTEGEIVDNMVTLENKSDMTEILPENVPKIQKIEPIIGEVQSVLLVHVDSPQHFYCQIIGEDFMEVAHHLNELNQKCSEMLPQLVAFHEGDFCVALASDEQWYRALVLKLDKSDDSCLVYFIDYGNTERVNSKNLKAVPAEFAKIKSQAVHCSLDCCFPIGKEWSEDCLVVINSLLNQSIQAEFVKFDEKEEVYHLKLFLGDDVILPQYFIENGFALSQRQLEPDKEERTNPESKVKTEIGDKIKDPLIQPSDVPDGVQTKLTVGDVIQINLQKVDSPENMLAKIMIDGKATFTIRCKIDGLEPTAESWSDEASQTIMIFAAETLDARVIGDIQDEQGSIFLLKIPYLINGLILSGQALACL